MNIERLDEVKGTLRLILTLAHGYQLTRLEYMEEAEKAGVGRTAFYSGIRILLDLGLVEETIDKRKGKRVKYNKLTEDGNAVAKLVIEIDKLLAGGARVGDTEVSEGRSFH